MADTLFHKMHQHHYPYYTNIQPTVPKVPASQDMFRWERPEQYTQKLGRNAWQHWTDKWYDFEIPTLRREELPKIADRNEPCSQPWQYRPGTSAVPQWSRHGKDWPIDKQRYLNNGRPPTEAKRARGMNRLSYRDSNLYPYTNLMTSTYRQPVYSIFGPMQKREVYGLTHQHNKHGFMPMEDYY